MSNMTAQLRKLIHRCYRLNEKSRQVSRFTKYNTGLHNDMPACYELDNNDWRLAKALSMHSCMWDLSNIVILGCQQTALRDSRVPQRQMTSSDGPKRNYHETAWRVHHFAVIRLCHGLKGHKVLHASVTAMLDYYRLYDPYNKQYIRLNGSRKSTMSQRHITRYVQIIITTITSIYTRLYFGPKR